MPFTATDYGRSIDIEGRAGKILAHVNHNKINTFNAHTDVIAYGSALVRGTKYDDAVAPTATGGEFIGIAIREVTDETYFNTNGDSGYDIGQYFTRLTVGLIYVPVETDIAIGDPVFFRHTDNGALVGNFFRNDADTANADEITAGAKWFKPALAGELAILELNLPV